MPLARDFRAAARNRLKGYWGAAILVCLVAVLLGGITNNISPTYSQTGNNYTYNSSPFPLEAFTTPAWPQPFQTILTIWNLAAFILGGAIELGVCAYFSRTMLGDRPPFSALFDRFHIFFKALGLRLFMGLFIFLWALLLIIPGIVASYRYAMAPYLMAEYPEMGIREAVNRSKQMMQGYKGDLFALHFSFIGWLVLAIAAGMLLVFVSRALGMLAAGIGGLLLSPYMNAAEAAFYLHQTGRTIPFAGNSENQSEPNGNPYAQPDQGGEPETL